MGHLLIHSPRRQEFTKNSAVRYIPYKSRNELLYQGYYLLNASLNCAHSSVKEEKIDKFEGDVSVIGSLVDDYDSILWVQR